MKTRRWVLVAIVVVAVLGAFLVAGGDSPEREARKATQSFIDQASTADGRAFLEGVRDEMNAEMRRQLRALDEEIRQLREENAGLEKELAE